MLAPACGTERMTGYMSWGALRLRFTVKFMWVCGHVCECCKVWDTNMYLCTSVNVLEASCEAGRSIFDIITQSAKAKDEVHNQMKTARSVRSAETRLPEMGKLLTKSVCPCVMARLHVLRSVFYSKHLMKEVASLNRFKIKCTSS